MATALSVSSTKQSGDVAIGEPVDYTITVTGYTAGDKVNIYIRLTAAAHTVYLSKLAVSLTGASLTGTFGTTWSLKTSETVGDYQVYVELVSNTAINTGTGCTFTCKLMTAWMLKNVYMAGVPFKDYDGVALNDAIAEMAIETAVAELEYDTKIYMYPKVVKSTDSGTYDVLINRVDYMNKDWRSGVGILTLPHYYVQSVTSITGWLADDEVLELPAEWMVVKKKRGLIRIVPTTALHARILGTIGLAIVLGTIAQETIPGFWDVEYIAGWDEAVDPFPRDLLRMLGLKTAIITLPIVANALRRGVASSSLSADGLSESISTPISGTTHLFSGISQAFTDDYKSMLLRFINRTRGPLTASI